MPLAGVATSKFPARNLAAIGFFGFFLAYRFSATHVTLGMSFGYASLLRIVQVTAIPFIFISVTTDAYVGLDRKESNQISGIINFARNIGGSIFISIMSAQVVNRGLIHQAKLQEYMQSNNLNFNQAVNQYSGALASSAGAANSRQMAQAQIYQQLNHQANALAYADVYMLLAYMSLIMVVAAFVLSKPKQGEAGAPEGAVH
jgi:DHA2 family multidrug resistance protein